MKTSFLIAAAALVLFSGCAIFQRSPTWDSVVASRSHYSGAADAGAKEGYINHLHQILSNAGVEHKVVAYHFHYHNAYREEAVQSATAVIYRDDTNPRNPWWVMDEYHHVPVWLPNWSVDAQLEFFVQRDVEVVSIKEYAGSQPRAARVSPAPHRRIAHESRPRKSRVIGITQSHSKRPAKPPVRTSDADPLTTTTLSGGHRTDSPSAVLFRSTHGTTFDPGSSVDRAKMTAMRRELLSRNQGVGLRPE